MILQDFLDTKPPRRNTVSLAEERGLLGSLAPTTLGTILSLNLNSGSDFQYIETAVDPIRPNPAAVNGRSGVLTAPSFDCSHPNLLSMF
ncbi:major allergen Mal d 1-like protein [Corchorus olitorius]|uniref:Major allergen Mal d 1-like protein n=1 Tax=Corchorus olitorius TaxID=93759 RepID=A0A1R3HWZ2_9ROSI|nr:major allergen Mal d 1-like protein [Corchorus olitorius]